MTNNTNSSDDHVSMFHPNLKRFYHSPPSPLGRAVGYFISIFLLMLLGWACFAQIDRVASSRGQLISQIRPQAIQSIRDGTVKHVYVREGEIVKQDQLLLTLDDETEQIQKLKSMQVLKDLNFELWWLQQMENLALNPTGTPLQPAPEGIDPKLVQLANHRIKNSIKNLNIELDVQKNRIKMTEAEIAKSKKVLINLEKLLNSAIEIERMNESLVHSNAISRMDYLKTIDRRLQSEKNLGQESANLSFLEEKRNAELNAKQKTIDKFILSISEKKVDLHKAVIENQLELKDILRRIELSKIRSPIAGTVLTGKVPQIGDVVIDSNLLMKVVPSDSKLEVLATIKNQDRGYVNAGMPVTLKLDGYSFIRYGTLNGTVDKVATTAQSTSNGDLVYPVIITLHNNSLTYNGNELPLISGMSLTAEIKVGQRKLIDFFIEPIAESFNNSFKEY